MKYNKILYNFFIIIAVFLFNACDEVEENTKKVKVNLTFYTDFQTNSSTTTLTPGEGIKTLRVIVAQNDQVVKNDYFYDISANASAGMRTFTLFDLPIGALDFYLIANEESNPNLNTWLTENYIINKIGNFTALSDRIIADEVSSPLVMSGKYTNILVDETTSHLKFPITRSIVKITLTITNRGQYPLDLSEIHFGKFKANSGYLFTQNEFKVPVSNKYTDFTIAKRITLMPDEATLCHTQYIYENQSALSNYTLSIVANDYVYPPVVLPISNEPMAKIIRNTHLNIQATVTPTALVITNYEVRNWIDQNVNLPSFN